MHIIKNYVVANMLRNLSDVIALKRFSIITLLNTNIVNKKH